MIKIKYINQEIVLILFECFGLLCMALATSRKMCYDLEKESPGGLYGKDTGNDCRMEEGTL
ncbi:MAG: hypothetical protein ACI3V0_05050 [Faecousia sp.]